MNFLETLRQQSLRAQVSEFRRAIELLTDLGIPHHVDHAPCRGDGKIGKDDAIQQAMADFGHNITSHCTVGIQVGDEMLVFFSGASDVLDQPDGCFIFRFNVKTREVVHNTLGRKIVAQEEE